MVDALGNPVAFHLTAGQASDLQGADVLPPGRSIVALLADRSGLRRQGAGHRADAAPGGQIVIPSHPTRKVRRDYDRVLYKDRHLIENFLAKLRQYRAIATRYDKTACNFLGAIYGIASVILLN